MTGSVVALSGGVGGAKLVHGLARVLEAGQLTAVVNTGDDFRHLGLLISPDIDSVIYQLAGLSDSVRGWGHRDETWHFMDALNRLGGENWFQLGDADLAMHVERSRRLALGQPLSQITDELRLKLGIRTRVLPMSDDPVRTRLLTDVGWLDFQEYFVRLKCAPAIRDLSFEGAAHARALPAVLTALARPDLRAVVICPSNPFVSIEPILAVPGIREALRTCVAPVVAITPIIGGNAVKGPAAKMMREMRLNVSGETVAHRYAGLIKGFVIDARDPMPVDHPEVSWAQAQTLMATATDQEELARSVLAIADRLT